MHFLIKSNLTKILNCKDFIRNINIKYELFQLNYGVFLFIFIFEDRKF